MMKNTILFLLSEVHNYHISLIDEIVTRYSYNMVVIYKDKDNKTPYQPPQLQDVIFKGKSTFDSYKDFKEYVLNVNPILVRTSGWVDKDYLKVSKTLKKSEVVSVVVSDTQWKNTIKQTLGTILYGRYIRSCFSKMMVAGPYQFEYARRLRFSKNDILFSNLSANTKIYSKDEPNLKFEKKIVFVGRLEKIKGIDILFDAWDKVLDKKNWKLELIGQGKYYKIIVRPDIVFKGYLSSDEIQQSMSNSAFFALPSLSEPWGVVMHEACLSGIPILCSDAVGSIPLFLIDGYNGFTFKTNDVNDLVKSIEKIIDLSDEELIRMRYNSLSLSKRITTPISAASLMSVLS